MFIVQLLYGIDQIMFFLNQNKKDFTSQIHDKSPQSTQEICKNCNSTLHLIGTSSNKKYCLKKFNSSQLFNESFVLENSMNKMTGITVDYDELVLEHYENQGNQQYSSLCKKCQSKVKCSGCFSEICLCSLYDHNQQHLENCHILVERDLPRYVMLELNESEVNLFQNHYLLESQITCSADAFRLMKDKSSFQKAWQQYNAMIEREDFYSLDYTTRFNLYENRAESYRLRKYLSGVEKEKRTIGKLNFCIEDYERCYELVKDKPEQIYKQSKSIMMIGIVEDDIAQLIEQHEKNKQLPSFQSEKKYNQALSSYNRARNILYGKNKNQLTHEQILLEMNIKNCQAFLYYHRQDFQKAIEQFQSLIVSMNALQKPVKREKAKFLNNTVECMNIFVEKLNWKDLHYIENILKRANDYGKQSYELRLCLFGAKYNLTLSSKENYEKAIKLQDECQKKIKQNAFTKQK